MKTEIVTPNGIFYSKDIHMVTMPGKKGAFGVLNGHITSLVGLQPGLVTAYDKQMKEIDHIFVSNGFVEVTEETTTILVENASSLSDHNYKDTLKRLKELQLNLNACQEECEKAKIEKDINIIENLISILKT